jgi:hypothetical protein
MIVLYLYVVAFICESCHHPYISLAILFMSYWILHPHIEAKICCVMNIFCDLIHYLNELRIFSLNMQYVEVVPQMEKQRRLEQILRSQERGSKVIIFCSTKRLCDQLARSIGRSFGAAAIHGDKSQGERDWVLNQFRSGKSPILVATDVAARGLDIKDIRLALLCILTMYSIQTMCEKVTILTLL